MTPATILKQIARVKEQIGALELALACPGILEGYDREQEAEDLRQLKKLLSHYEDELRDWNAI